MVGPGRRRLDVSRWPGATVRSGVRVDRHGPSPPARQQLDDKATRPAGKTQGIGGEPGERGGRGRGFGATGFGPCATRRAGQPHRRRELRQKDRTGPVPGGRLVERQDALGPVAALDEDLPRPVGRMHPRQPYRCAIRAGPAFLETGQTKPLLGTAAELHLEDRRRRRARVEHRPRQPLAEHEHEVRPNIQRRAVVGGQFHDPLEARAPVRSARVAKADPAREIRTQPRREAGAGALEVGQAARHGAGQTCFAGQDVRIGGRHDEQRGPQPPFTLQRLEQLAKTGRW
jgi:hypothetical protein